MQKNALIIPIHMLGLGSSLNPLPANQTSYLKFCLHDLANLTVEKMCDYVLSKAKCMQKDNVNDNERKGFLQKYSLETVSHSTIYCWMTTILSFSCCNKKHYYIDEHEWEDVILYCNMFCKNHDFITAVKLLGN